MTSSEWPTFYFNYQLNLFTAPEAKCELSCEHNQVHIIQFLKGSSFESNNHS